MPTSPSNFYAREVCGLCQGKGTHPDHPCPACNGQGSVLVRQPALHCPRCGGNGKAKTNDPAFYESPLCAACKGTGLVMAFGQSGGT
jgi:DnaJ-class molecular chaperone